MDLQGFAYDENANAIMFFKQSIIEIALKVAIATLSGNYDCFVFPWSCISFDEAFYCIIIDVVCIAQFSISIHE